MKNRKIRNNLISSLLYQVVLIAMGFLLPRLYLENFGSEVNGVLSTVKQILTYLLLLEAGVGLATTQALYKKIGQSDRDGVSAVLAATGRYYTRTGVVYLVLVLLIAAAYAFLIPNVLSGPVVFAIVLLNALPSLFSYFFQAKYRLLLEADGRKYVINHAETALQLVTGAAKILVLVFSKNLILIQLAYCVPALIQLLFLLLYAKRRYGWLDRKKAPDFSSISQKNSVLVHQVSGLVFNNTDVLLLSVLADFKAVSVYAIYNMFFVQVQNFITSILSSFTFALGQAFHRDRTKFDQMYRVYETFYVSGTFFIYTLMGVFLLPLIRIYTGGITDAQYVNPLLLLLFVIAGLLAHAKIPCSSVIEFDGAFQKTRSFALWEMALNLSFSVVGILLFDLCGALLGTVAALIYRSVVTYSFTNKNILKRSVFASYKILAVNGAVFALVMILLPADTFLSFSFLPLVLRGVIHAVWIGALYLVTNFLFHKKAFQTALELYREKKSQ